MIERTFQNIPEGELAKADQQSILDNLGWADDSTWDDLLQSKRVLLISEAGSGKTFECRTQAKRLWDEGKPSFFIELATLATDELENLLDYDEQERLDAWLSSQSDEATLFLDSYDELKLSRVSFEQALKRLKKGIRNQLHRVRVVITTRPIPFDEKLVRRILPIPPSPKNESKEETFAKIAMGEHKDQQVEIEKKEIEDWRTVALMPLSDKQISEFASNQGIEKPTALLEDLRKRNAQQFARRPQDLIELCADWRVHKRIRLHSEQVASNVRLKLLPREDRLELNELSTDQATDGACRLALAMLVTRRFTIRHSASSDDIKQDAALDPSVILSDWKPDEIKTLLERPLFGFASYGRVRFHNICVLEFLAAENLRILQQTKGMTFRALKRLIFSQTRGEIVVRPTMRPVAGWLALADSKVFEILRDNEPSVLLNEGDPEAFTQTQSTQALNAYVDCYGEGGWRGLSIPHVQIHRLATFELAKEITQIWEGGVENPEVREILLSLIGEGNITKCADIAYEVAVDNTASMSERLYAIEALVELNDSRLKPICTELSSNVDIWSEEIVPRVLIRVFPKNISLEQLCSSLNFIGASSKNVSSFSWQLSQLITTSEFDQTSLEAFRDRLIDLVSKGLTWTHHWKPFTSDLSQHRDLLAAVCVHGLKLETNDAWLYASVLALRLKKDGYSNDGEAHKTLRKMLLELSSDANSRLFWIEDSLLQSFTTFSDSWGRFYEVVDHGIVNITVDRDLLWIKEQLGDISRSKDDREFLLESAIHITHGQGELLEHASELKDLVSDQSDMIPKINKWLQPRRSDKWDKKREKREKQQERKKAKNKASWIQFRRELINHPEKMFSQEKREITAWNLWRVLNNFEGDNEEQGWNRHFIEEQFGKEIANKIRLMLMDVWREERPTLPFERPEDERRNFLQSWKMGLFAIYAEAEDPNWVRNISEEEAELAARHSMMNWNGLPLWLEQLIKAHHNAVNVTLCEELRWELSQYDIDQGHSELLKDISYSSKPIVSIFLPILRTWLDSNRSITNDGANITFMVDRLRRVIDILLKNGEDDDLAYLLKIGHECLKSELPSEVAFVWLPVVMALDHDLGIESLENQLMKIDPDAQSEGVKWIRVLFNDRPESISLSDFTPNQLIKLVRLAYEHVRKEDDNVREGNGPYSINDRDDAERARSYILEALLSAKGETGFQTKQDLSKYPIFEHIKDRILAIAKESWANEIDSETYDQTQAVALDRTGEAPASTNSAMFAILQDRLTDLDDLLLSDTSPRDAWAGISQENIMRREIARELKHASNSLYTVDQEAVTADEKETDIRLRSVVSEHEAVIELKLADGRTGRDLRDTINDQLVKKYMAAETSRSGCLLITIAKNRKWDHPDNGLRIALSELKLLLQDEAIRVEESMGGSIALYVHILDLRPRLPKEK